MAKQRNAAWFEAQSKEGRRDIRTILTGTDVIPTDYDGLNQAAVNAPAKAAAIEAEQTVSDNPLDKSAESVISSGQREMVLRHLSDLRCEAKRIHDQQQGLMHHIDTVMIAVRRV